MKTQKLALALTIVNLAVLLFVGMKQGSTNASSEAPILRGRALELVDDRGRVRAQIDVYPEGEVVFRLRDAKGTIRVKMGADEAGAGLLLLDETTEPAIHMVARRTGTSETQKTTGITLNGAAGQQRVFKP